MPKQSRNVLKNVFKNGNLLSEMNFLDLIDSTWNINDDGLGKSIEEGLQIGPSGNSQKIISLYKNNLDGDPKWQIAIDINQSSGLSFIQPELDNTPLLFLDEAKKVGIGTSTPKTTLDIQGCISSSSRVGTYRIGKVKADAQWHEILSGLKGCNVFEIVAEAKGNIQDGNYSLIHAIAMNADAGQSGTIKMTHTSYRWFDFRDKIKLRWRGVPGNYSLEIKTGKHYFLTEDQKEANQIRFHICRLWDDKLEF